MKRLIIYISFFTTIAICGVAGVYYATSRLPPPRQYDHFSDTRRTDAPYVVLRSMDVRTCRHACYARKWCLAVDFDRSTGACSIFNREPDASSLLPAAGHTYARALIARAPAHPPSGGQQFFATPGGLPAGRRFCACIDMHNHTNTINLYVDIASDDFIWAFMFRHNTNWDYVQRGTHNADAANGNFETDGGLPFVLGATYHICFVGKQHHYLVTVNDAPFVTFPHYVPPSNVTFFRVTSASPFYEVTFK